MLRKSFEIPAFIDKHEITALLNFYKKLPKTVNTGQKKKQAYTTGFPIESLPFEDLMPRLEKVFGKFNVTVSMFLEEFDPWNVHSDYFKDDANPYYAVLIPLEVQDKITHTLVFNELGDDKDWKRKLQVKENFKYSSYELQLLSHIKTSLLSKLSIDTLYKWHPGKLIAWNRNLLHSSDNFLVGGLEKKTALVLFLNKDD